MAAIVGIVVLCIFGVWLGRLLGPALVAAVVALAAPIWIVGGLVVDLLRFLITSTGKLGLGLAALCGGLVAVPFLPVIFVVSYVYHIIKFMLPASAAPAPAVKPVQMAARQTAEVIDFATARRMRKDR